MNLWQRLRKRLSGPWLIEGSENRYYLPARPEKPVRIDRMFACKGLDGRWAVFTAKERPMLPVGHYAKVNLFGQPTGLYGTVMPPQERREKIADGLSLREAFDRVRRHEEGPPRLQVTSSRGGRQVLELRQNPVDSPHYWRRLAL